MTDVKPVGAYKPPVKVGQEEEAEVHRIRITLTSRNVKNLEKGEQEYKDSQELSLDSAFAFDLFWKESNIRPN